jgi:hypothetical protein
MPVNALAVSCSQHLLRINLEANNPGLKLFVRPSPRKLPLDMFAIGSRAPACLQERYGLMSFAPLPRTRDRCCFGMWSERRIGAPHKIPADAVVKFTEQHERGRLLPPAELK